MEPGLSTSNSSGSTSGSFRDMSGQEVTTEMGREDGCKENQRNKLDEDMGGEKNGQTIPRTSLQRFYSGASVLVTGATGFMGKVLIEKLLRSCPDIETIYMMVREKKGRSLDERIDDLVSSPCFDRIKKEIPEYRWKLKAVAGDIGSEGLGISEADGHLLQQQAVVHVSTAYSNCPRSEIGECFYDPPMTGDQAIHLAETTDLVTLDHLSHKVMKKWPNTYAFTKAVSENVVKTYGRGLPIGVFRPSIVMCTNAEPMPGWTDNPYGPMGLVVGVYCGLLRTFRADEDSEVDMVPCDLAINGLIASARDVADRSPSEEIPIYNFVSSSKIRETFRSQVDVTFKYGQEFPTMRAIWYRSLIMTRHRALLWFLQLTLHILPALLVDGFCYLAKKPPQMVRIYGKVHKFTNVLTYFLTRKWSFDVTNMTKLWSNLDDDDKLLFNFDTRSLTWEQFVWNSGFGIRIYLLKDPLDTLPASRVRLQRLYLLHRFTQCLLAIFLGWLSLLSLSYILSSYSTQAMSIKK